MKCQVLVLIALAGCAFTSAIFDAENRDIGSPDPNLVSRDGPAGLDVEVDLDLTSRTDADIEIRSPQPPQPRRCPTRRIASPFRRIPKYPFPTTPIIGYFFRVPFPLYNTTPLYLVYKLSTNDWLYTTSFHERYHAINGLGYTNRGVAGRIFKDQRCGGSRLYRMYNPRRRTHFYTVSVQERSVAMRFGWINEGVIGYIFRP